MAEPKKSSLDLLNGAAKIVSAPKKDKGPVINKDSAEEFEKGFNESISDRMKRYKQNLKSGLGIK